MGEKGLNIEQLRDFYETNMYGKWRKGEKVSYELLGPDTRVRELDENGRPRNPFEIIGGELVKITVEAGDRRSKFIVHAYLPRPEDVKYPKGSPFIVCMHPIMPMDIALKQGWTLLVMETNKIASDDIRHLGAFYDLYPYRSDTENDRAEQTGALMAWAWGASKVLDAVQGGLDRAFSKGIAKGNSGSEKAEHDEQGITLDRDASMVTGVSRYGKAVAVCGAFETGFRMTIPACSGAGGLALYNYISEGKTYDFESIGGPSEYTYTKNEPLDCLQSDGERGWFNDSFLQYKTPAEIPEEQWNLPIMAMSPERYYFLIAACMGEDWVNAPAMWECYRKADEYYSAVGLSDHLVCSFHREGHAVTAEDMELIIRYFEKMYYGMDTIEDMGKLKTSVFALQ